MRILEIVGHGVAVHALIVAPIVLFYFLFMWLFRAPFFELIQSIALGFVPLTIIVTALAWRNPGRKEWSFVFSTLAWVPMLFWFVIGLIIPRFNSDPYAVLAPAFLCIGSIPAGFLVMILGAFFERIRHLNLVGKFLP